MGDIVRSIAVIGVIILALYGIGRFFTTEPEEKVKPIDYATVVAQARPAAAFPLLAPPDLPEGWRATSARFETSAWHLGVLTDSDDYIGLEQLTADVEQAVDRFADGSSDDGTAEVAGETWEVRSGPDGRVTYVRAADGMTTLVNSSASKAVVEDYIESLSDSAPVVD